MNFINNIKELKEISFKKLLFISSIILLFLLYIRDQNAKKYNEFLKTVEGISSKIHYSEWSSILDLVQSFLGIISLVSVILYIIMGFLYEKYWKNMRNCTTLNYKRKSLFEWLGRLYVTVSVSYLNLYGYRVVLDAEYVESKLFTFVSIFGAFMLFLYTMAFLLSKDDEGWN